MKQRPERQWNHAVQLRPASVEEAGLFYSQVEEDRDWQSGTVGHVRMDFGHGGKKFWHTWWSHNQDQFNTPEFKETLQTVVDALRRDGPLKDLSAMRSYCQQHGGAITKDGENFGYIAETEHYQFCLRCTPVPGHYQGYLYCYDKRQQEMAQHDIVVGRVTYADGTRQEFTDSELYLKTIKEELPYRELVSQARTAMAEYIGRMESADAADPVLAHKLVELAHELDSVTGKKQYGYLPKNIKELVDGVVDELAKQPDVEECYEVWNGLRDELEQYYKAKPRVRHPLSEQKEFRVIKNVIVQEAEQLWQELEQTPQQKTEQDAQVEADSEEETQNDLLRETREIRTTSKVHSAPNPAVAAAVLNLLHHMGQIFRDNAPAPSNPMGVRMDSKRRKKLMEKRLALGHKMGDHENPEIQQTM